MLDVVLRDARQAYLTALKKGPETVELLQHVTVLLSKTLSNDMKDYITLLLVTESQQSLERNLEAAEAEYCFLKQCILKTLVESFVSTVELLRTVNPSPLERPDKLIRVHVAARQP